MTRLMLLAMVVGSIGCTTEYYVADVHRAGDKLVMTKCELGYNGRATHYCHQEVIPEAPARGAQVASP